MSRYTKITLDHQVYSDSCVDSDGNPLGLAKDNGDGTYTLYVYNEENVSIEQDKTDGKYTYNYHDDKDGYTDKTTMYTITNLQINPDILADYSAFAGKGKFNWRRFRCICTGYISENSHGMEVRFCSA